MAKFSAEKLSGLDKEKRPKFIAKTDFDGDGAAGYKKCPSCLGLVRGPKTAVCPSCKADFPASIKTVSSGGKKRGSYRLDLTSVEMFVSTFANGKMDRARELLESLQKHDPKEMLGQLGQYEKALEIQSDKSLSPATKLAELAKIL